MATIVRVREPRARGPSGGGPKWRCRQRGRIAGSPLPVRPFSCGGASRSRNFGATPSGGASRTFLREWHAPARPRATSREFVSLVGAAMATDFRDVIPAYPTRHDPFGEGADSWIVTLGQAGAWRSGKRAAEDERRRMRSGRCASEDALRRMRFGGCASEDARRFLAMENVPVACAVARTDAPGRATLQRGPATNGHRPSWRRDGNAAPERRTVNRASRRFRDRRVRGPERSERRSRRRRSRRRRRRPFLAAKCRSRVPSPSGRG